MVYQILRGFHCLRHPPPECIFASQAAALGVNGFDCGVPPPSVAVAGTTCRRSFRAHLPSWLILTLSRLASLGTSDSAAGRSRMNGF